MMLYREAIETDIVAMHDVRVRVTENILSNPALISPDDYHKHLFVKGKGWVCHTNNLLIGFAIADLKDHNIWALFVRPGYEGRGIGQTLHNLMLNWYFANTAETVWLSTGINTRAERFYRSAGWTLMGPYGTSEHRYEMSFEKWNLLKNR